MARTADYEQWWCVYLGRVGAELHLSKWHPICWNDVCYAEKMGIIHRTDMLVWLNFIVWVQFHMGVWLMKWNPRLSWRTVILYLSDHLNIGVCFVSVVFAGGILFVQVAEVWGWDKLFIFECWWELMKWLGWERANAVAQIWTPSLLKSRCIIFVSLYKC